MGKFYHKKGVASLQLPQFKDSFVWRYNRIKNPGYCTVVASGTAKPCAGSLGSLS
jgi:hypothetical protein